MAEIKIEDPNTQMGDFTGRTSTSDKLVNFTNKNKADYFVSSHTKMTPEQRKARAKSAKLVNGFKTKKERRLMHMAGRSALAKPGYTEKQILNLKGAADRLGEYISYNMKFNGKKFTSEEDAVKTYTDGLDTDLKNGKATPYHMLKSGGANKGGYRPFHIDMGTLRGGGFRRGEVIGNPVEPSKAKFAIPVVVGAGGLQRNLTSLQAKYVNPTLYPATRIVKFIAGSHGLGYRHYQSEELKAGLERYYKLNEDKRPIQRPY